MEATARGNEAKTLQNIAYISILDSADLEFLLWDLQDAIAAYARLSGTALPARSIWGRMMPAALQTASYSQLRMRPMARR